MTARPLRASPPSSGLLPFLYRQVSALKPGELEALLESLPPSMLEELDALERASRPRSNKYLDRVTERKPTLPSATQRAFLVLDDVRHVLFGGAAGGGKSEAMLYSALQYVDVPGYAALICRSNFQELQKPGALVPRSHEWLAGTDAHWRGDTMTWHFPGGAVLTFAHLQDTNSHLHIQGAEVQFIGFDEAALLRPHQMQYLYGNRMRRAASSPVPLRTRYASNPGGVAHAWLVEQFMTPPARRDWVFIPSKFTDNPGLDVESYEKDLSSMTDATLRAQMRDGDWSAVDRSEMVVPEFDAELEAFIVEERARPLYFTPYVSADVGSVDLTYLPFGYLDFVEGVLVIENELCLRDPTTTDIGDGVVAMETTLWSAARTDGRAEAPLRYCDTDWRLVKDLAAAPYRINFIPTAKAEADATRRACRGALKQGKIRIHPRCKVLLATLKHARRKPNGDYERTKETGHADAWDALVYLWRNVQWNRNPFPAAQRGLRQTPAQEFSARNTPTSRNAEEIRKALLGVKPLK